MIYLLPLLLLIGVLIVLIRDYRHLHRINPTSDILFAEAPDKTQLDLMINDAYPIVVMNKIDENLTLEDLEKKMPNEEITYSYKTKEGDNTIKIKEITKYKDDMLLLKNKSIIEKSDINNVITQIVEGFNRPLTIYPSINTYAHIVSKETRIPLRKNTNDTNLLIVMEGHIIVFLVSPLYQDTMYETNGTTPIDIWNPDLKKYPKYSKSKIASDTVREKEILYIPPKWWYAIYSPDSSFIIQVQRDNIVSQYLK
jgi:hypothetical protein